MISIGGPVMNIESEFLLFPVLAIHLQHTNISKFVLFSGSNIKQMSLPAHTAWMLSVCDMSIAGSKLYICASKDGLLEYDIV